MRSALRSGSVDGQALDAVTALNEEFWAEVAGPSGIEPDGNDGYEVLVRAGLRDLAAEPGRIPEQDGTIAALRRAACEVLETDAIDDTTIARWLDATARRTAEAAPVNAPDGHRTIPSDRIS